MSSESNFWVDRYREKEHPFYGMWKVLNRMSTVQGIFYTKETADEYCAYLEASSAYFDKQKKEIEVEVKM